ncbi:MAG: PilZ domain-containing protein [Planctomycetaceae bacterium]
MSTTSPSDLTAGANSPDCERRREERFPLPADVEIQSTRTFPEIPDLGVLRDVSESGVGLEHHRPLQLGEIVVCKILDAPIDVPCEYQVEILWGAARKDGSCFSGGRILQAQR